jgi:hypothetical protein
MAFNVTVSNRNGYITTPTDIARIIVADIASPCACEMDFMNSLNLVRASAKANNLPWFSWPNV